MQLSSLVWESYAACSGLAQHSFTGDATAAIQCLAGKSASKRIVEVWHTQTDFALNLCVKRAQLCSVQATADLSEGVGTDRLLTSQGWHTTADDCPDVLGHCC